MPNYKVIIEVHREDYSNYTVSEIKTEAKNAKIAVQKVIDKIGDTLISNEVINSGELVINYTK